MRDRQRRGDTGTAQIPPPSAWQRLDHGGNLGAAPPRHRPAGRCHLQGYFHSVPLFSGEKKFHFYPGFKIWGSSDCGIGFILPDKWKSFVSAKKMIFWRENPPQVEEEPLAPAPRDSLPSKSQNSRVLGTSSPVLVARGRQQAAASRAFGC